MKKIYSLLMFVLFTGALTNAQCPALACNNVPAIGLCVTFTGSAVNQQFLPCPPGQQGALTLLWLCTYVNGNLTVQLFLTAVNGCVLPIELTGFGGELIEKSVVLKWKTATETENSHFTVERSYDGSRFAPLEVIQGAGTTTEETNYEYTDETVVTLAKSKEVYYRLKQTDFDGTSSYSPVINLSLNGIFQQFDIINTTQDAGVLNVIYHSMNESEVGVFLYDLSGKVMYNSKTNAEEGFNQYDINVANVPAGAYLLTISNGENIVTKKLLRTL